MKQIIFLTTILTFGVLSIVGQDTISSADDFFKKGLGLLHQGRFSDAIESFEMAERLSPNQAETSANIGAAFMGLKKPIDAAKAFQKAIDLKPLEATFRTAICRAFAAQKDFDKAIAACKEGTRLAPDSARATETLLEVMESTKAPVEQLKQQIDLALSRFSNDVGVLDIAADYSQMVGDLAYAAGLFERLTQLLPNDAYYFARLADVYLKLNREEDAVASARRSLSLEPNNPYANYFMGKLFLELGQNQDAGEAFSKVVNSGKQFPNARYYLAISEKRRGHCEAALAAISEAASRNPDEFEFQYELGDLLTDMARYEDAIEPSKRAVALRPQDLMALAQLGLSLFESTRFDAGIQVLEEANRLYPGNEVITMFLRVARSRQRNIPKIPEMQEFVKNNPKDIETRVDLIELLAYARRIDEAEVYVQELWKLAPKDPKPYIQTAVSYSTAGKVDKALDAYNRALAVRPDPAIYLGFANIYARRGMSDEASEAYRKVLELKPDAPGILQFFGNHLLNSGKRREALDIYKRSLALKPLNAPVLFNAAILSFKLGDSVSGKQYLSELRGVDPVGAARIDRCLKLRIWN